jgi:hypothetical protein
MRCLSGLSVRSEAGYIPISEQVVDAALLPAPCQHRLISVNMSILMRLAVARQAAINRLDHSLTQIIG